MNAVAPTTQRRAAAAAEILARRRALGSLRAFGQFMRTTGALEFQFEPAPHHLLMIDRLERLARGDIKRLMICAPPGSAKSTYGSIWFVLWMMARDPTLRVIGVGNVQALAAKFNRTRRNIALNPEWRRLSGAKLAADLSGVELWGTDRGGSCLAVGVGGSVVGHRADLLAIDDPIQSLEVAMSPTQLDQIFDWWQSEALTRLVPDGRVLLVSTRWARRDLCGRILEDPEGWEVLRLPMVCDEQPDPMGRELGELLWPSYFPLSIVNERRQNEFLWMTQYQQRPLDESGAWVGPEHMLLEECAPSDLRIVIGVDLALSVGKGDYTVLAVCGLDSDRRLHIIDIVRDRCDIGVTSERLYALCERYGPDQILIDDDGQSRIFAHHIAESWRAANRAPPPLHLMPIAGRAKEVRASALRAMFHARQVFILSAPWSDVVVRELQNFPAGSHDDVIDAVGLVARRLDHLSSPQRQEIKAPTQPASEPWTLDELFETRERIERRRNFWS